MPNVERRLFPGNGGREGSRLLGLRERGLRVAQSIDPRVFALICAGAIFAVTVLGEIHEGEAVSSWNLDREGEPPAQLSALFLWCAGALALVAEGTRARGVVGSRVWVLLGLLFVFMGVDEWRALHERLELALGVPWPVLYGPLLIPGAVAFSLVVRGLWSRGRSAAILLVAGAAAWFLAQVHDRVATGDVVPEEVLELGGGAFFALALLLVLRPVWPTPRRQRGAHTPASV
jgi:hypothetical protein